MTAFACFGVVCCMPFYNILNSHLYEFFHSLSLSFLLITYSYFSFAFLYRNLLMLSTPCSHQLKWSLGFISSPVSKLVANTLSLSLSFLSCPLLSSKSNQSFIRLIYQTRWLAGAWRRYLRANTSGTRFWHRPPRQS